jgi:hypothetical protein
MLAFLGPRHNFVPMWVECWAEFEGPLRILLGYDSQCPSCWARIGGHSVPLALNSYIGPAWIYLYSPAAFAWFSGLTSDPYVYRYTLIAALLANTWMFYLLLRQLYRGWVAFWGAAAFATTPILFLGTLAEHGSVHFAFLPIFLTALLFVKYVRGGSSAYLVGAALALGSAVLGRIESLIWLVLPFLVYLAMARRGVIFARWRQTRRKARVAALSATAFCLGAGPMIAYNLLCPENNLLSFILKRIFPSSLGNGGSIQSRLLIRLEQFWSTNLLSQWPMWEIHWPTPVFAVLWFFSATLIVWRWVKFRKPYFPLVIVLMIVPLSIVTTGSLRNEHLVTLQPAVLLVVISGVAFVARIDRLRRLAMAAIVTLVLSNTITVAGDWRYWNSLPDTAQTMLNQSDPVTLSNYLSERHSRDRIIFTDVGMPQYIQYMTAGRLKGEDILEWYDAQKFVGSINFALLDAGRRRVFVAVSKDRGRPVENLPLTELLYKTLADAEVPFTVTHLSGPRNKFLYDLLVVEAGVKVAERKLGPSSLKVAEVTDIHEIVQDGSSYVIGSIKGEGLRDRDAMIVNGHVYPTTFGNANWITFLLPSDVIGTDGAWQLKVIRPSTLESSLPLDVLGEPVVPAQGEPATIRLIQPVSTRAGLSFNQQPNGMSALSVVAENARADSVIVWQGKEMATTYGGPASLSCLVPAELYAKPGQYEVYLNDRRGHSNRVIFTVENAP